LNPHRQRFSSSHTIDDTSILVLWCRHLALELVLAFMPASSSNSLEVSTCFRSIEKLSLTVTATGLDHSLNRWWKRSNFYSVRLKPTTGSAKLKLTVASSLTVSQ